MVVHCDWAAWTDKVEERELQQNLEIWRSCNLRKGVTPNSHVGRGGASPPGQKEHQSPAVNDTQGAGQVNRTELKEVSKETLLLNPKEKQPPETSSPTGLL